jgi:hypothetical protein
VSIIFQVTRGTFAGRAPETTILMATLALGRPVPAYEGESGQVVIKGDLRPPLRRVAWATIQAKLASVGIVGLVTTKTVPAHSPQICRRACPGMAGPAGRLGMIAQQGKSELIVIKCGPIGIQPIMAGQAIGPKVLQVGLEVGGIQGPVTGLAGDRIKAGEIICVAVGTDKCRAVGSLPVAGQRITGGLMGKTKGIDHRQGSLSALVLGVTGKTGQIGVAGQEGAVKAGRVLELQCHLDVANLAARRHAVILGWPRVASRAFTPNLRVGAHAVPYGFTGALAQRARAEKGAAPQDQKKSDGQQGNPGRRQPAWGKTTQSLSNFNNVA